MTIFKKALLTGLVLFVFSMPAFAQAAEPVSIAVVDIQQLLTESKAGKNIQDQMEKRKSTFVEELKKQEQELRENEKTLSEQRASLPAEEFAKKAKEFEQKLNESRRDAQERKKSLEESAVAALGKLRAEILKIVEAETKEKGFNLVVTRQSVVVANNDIDITPGVLAKLDKQVSAIALENKSN